MVLCSLLKYKKFFITIFLYLFLNISLFADSEALKKFKEAKNWLYQLQNLNFNLVKDAGFDILVTDYSWDGTEEKEYKAGQIKRLKSITKMVILSYLSIGEAEDYRFYWKSIPKEIIDAENPSWEGNYKVKYWDNRWKKIIFEYIDRIVDMGFDGLYLDLIDAYQYFEKTKSDAKDLMINFVVEIANYCREKKGLKDYIIVPQNGEELLTEKRYLDVISGIAREEVYFRAMDIPSEDEKEAEFYLDIALKNGKKVLTVDYCTNISNIREVYKKAGAKGYVPYCTVVELDRMIINKIY
jgi:cysteinyl-tRNA synthetase